MDIATLAGGNKETWEWGMDWTNDPYASREFKSKENLRGHGKNKG